MDHKSELLNTSLLQNFCARSHLNKIRRRRKDRSTNFSKEEIMRLQNLVEKYKNILMCKRTDGTSTKQKEQTWVLIEKEFNATGEIPRTTKQLKYKFENMKRSAKKVATRERQEMRRTGGGKPPSLPPAAEESAEWLRSMMSGSIDGIVSLYDDDVITPNVVSVDNTDYNAIQPDEQEENELKNDEISIMLKRPMLVTDVVNSETTEVPHNTKLDVPRAIVIETIDKSFDYSTPHSSLKRPMATPLRRQIKRKPDASESIIKRVLREQKISILKELNEIELERIKQEIKNQNELHQQLMQHNEERHKLELEKLKLEIDFLKGKINTHKTYWSILLIFVLTY